MKNMLIISGLLMIILVIVAVIAFMVFFAPALFQKVAITIPDYEKPYLAIPIFLGLMIIGFIMINNSRK